MSAGRSVFGSMAGLWFLLQGSAGLAQPWQPPPPAANAFDWIRLVSGEWLGGEIKGLRNEKLEFDSDKLDVLELDWEDVAELRSPHVYTYVFEGRSQTSGTATLRDSTLAVADAAGVHTYRRPQLLSIVPAGKRELDYWSLNLHLGLVTRAGNTEQQDLNTLVRVRRVAPLTRLALDYGGNFGRIGDTQNINNHNGKMQFDIFLAHRFYMTVPAVDLFADEFQNIDLRVTPSVGLGMRVVDHKRVSLDLDLGAGYQWTRFRSVQPGEPDATDQAAFIPGLDLESEPTDDMDFDLSYVVGIGLPDTGETYHHLLGVWSLELTDIFDFEFSFAWDRAESPRPDADGIVPKRDDLRTSFGLGIEF